MPGIYAFQYGVHVTIRQSICQIRFELSKIK